jgi:flagellar protein FliS
MLYDGAIKNVNLAMENLSQKHKAFDKFSNCLIKAQDIISELMVSLDFEKGGEIAKNLFSLYLYANRQLFEANIKKDMRLLAEVKRILSELRGAWIEVAQKTQQEGRSAGVPGINIAG